MSRNPTLAEIANLAMDGALEQLFISLPGRVVRYDGATQQVDVQPIVKVKHTSEDGEAIVQQLPVIPSVPVVFPGSGPYTLTFPIAAGDTGLLVFSGASMDKWSQATSDEPLDPETHARHALSDAVFIPGLKNFKRPRQSVPTDHIRIGMDGASAQGAGLGEVIKTFLDTLKTWLDTHTHTGVTTGVGVSGVPAVLSTSVPIVASATVKVTS